MASGFCLRVLLLSLINYGQLALGNVNRYQGRNLRPSEPAESSPRSYNPVRPRYDAFVQPRAAAASSKVPEGFSVGHQGGQVDSYSQRGSVPSYGPASNPSQVSQSSFYQRKPDPLYPESSKGGRRGSNIVSSGAIVIKPETPPQQESGSSISDLYSKTSTGDVSSMQFPETYPAAQQSQRQPVHPAPPVQSKVGMRDGAFASNAQSPWRFSVNPPSPQLPASGPAVLQSKASVRDGVYTSGVTSPGTYPSSKLPQMPVAPESPRQQSKATWKSVPSSNSQYSGTYSKVQPSSKRPASSADLKSKAGMRDSLYAPSAQPLPSHPAFSAPAVLQTKEGMWDSLYAPSAQSQETYSSAQLVPSHPAFSAPAVLQTKEGMWDSLYAPSTQSQIYSSSYPAFSAPVKQTAGMWDSELASGAKFDSIEHDDATPRGVRPEHIRQQLRDRLNFDRLHMPMWMTKLQLPSSLPFNVFPNRAGMMEAGSIAQVDQIPRLSRPVQRSSFRYDGPKPQLASAQRSRRPLS